MRIISLNLNYNFYRRTPLENTSGVYLNPMFGSNTSAGNPLKKLRGIKCPYFGVEMLSGKDINNIERKLEQCNSVNDVVKVLSKYKKNMQKIEKNIFKRFEKCSTTHPDFKLQNCLKMWYHDALIKLKLEEFSVLDDIDKLSLKLTPENALLVHSKTTEFRQIILKNEQSRTFKRKMLLDSLDKIKPSKKERKIFAEIKDKATYMPTSGTSENAFIVKYASRSHQEIAKRILKPSVATIEHIKPNSKNGENDIGNFILVSNGANCLRSNTPLYRFIKRFPKIPNLCQNTINQIIRIINANKFRGHETYPYKVKRTFAQESKGAILLDLSQCKYNEEQAVAAEKSVLSYQKSKTKGTKDS